MKEKIVKIVVNALIGALTSIASVYLGASAVEAVAVGGTSTAAIGEQASHAALNALALFG